MKLTPEQIDRLKQLEDSAGRITPSLVVADAKKKSSPLHVLFDWSKDRAAEAWWLECAREILREVRGQVVGSTVSIRVPIYVQDPDATGQGYRTVIALKQDTTSAREALISALRMAAGNLGRARDLSVALDLVGELDSLITAVTGLQARVSQPEKQHAA